jgi:hypothetical protein
MGLFDTHCVESGLALRGAVRLVPIVETTGGFELLAGSSVGEYDGYGGVDLSWSDPSSRALAAELGGWCVPVRRPGIDGRSAWRAFSDEHHSVRRAGRLVSYVLFDAVVAEVMERAQREGTAGSARCDAFGRVFADRDRMLALAVEKRGTRLRPVWHSLGGQYRQEDVASFLGAARDRYGAEPEMLAAIDANARRWSE